MREGLPFDDQTIDILIADLSLHYFTEDRTRHVLNDIHRVLKVNGLLLCRLNSLKEITNKGEVRKTQEMYFFKNEGIYRRFFDQDEIQRFFSEDKWEHIRIEEYELNRYTNSKMLWEIAMKPRYIV
ncbi:Methyltransferase domain protein [compost metagenome]